MNEMMQKLMLLIQQAGTAVDNSEPARRAKAFAEQLKQKIVSQMIPGDFKMPTPARQAEIQEDLMGVNQTPFVQGVQRMGQKINPMMQKFMGMGMMR
jgi:hypothetical protein